MSTARNSAVRRIGTVAVLGNGPVGASLALLLARWGVPTIVVEQRDERDPVGLKAIVQQRDVLDIWESVGAGARIAAEGLTWQVARTFYRDRELFSLTYADSGQSPMPPFVNIAQARTEAILDDRVAAQPLIDVRWRHRVTGIAQDAGGVTLTCRSPGGEVEIRAAYAVVCAGPRAEDLRGMLGVRMEGSSSVHRFLICDLRADLPGWANERRFYFDPPWNPGRQVLVHPCPDSMFRIDWNVPDDFTEPSEVDSRIRAVIGDRPYQLKWSSVYTFHSRVVDRMRAGRVLLAGDAAHLYSPFGARGLNSGVQDAENAAWKLAFVLRGWADDALLDSYHDERHPAALENLDVTRTTMRFLSPDTEAQHQHRVSTLEHAGTDPVARAAVDSGRLAEPFWYVDSPLTTVDPTRPFAGRPPRGAVPPPAPGILVPDAPIDVDGTPTTLRRIAREGFLLLAGDGDAVASDIVINMAWAATEAPVRLIRMTDKLRDVLAARPGELWIVRPDAHIAAVLADPGPRAVTGALRRALGSGIARRQQPPPS